MPKKERRIVFMTEDRWVREKGTLDPTDEEILKEAAQGGEVVVMTLREALEEMAKEAPEKFDDFKDETAERIGKPIKTMEELADLAQHADDRMSVYEKQVRLLMTKEQAIQVRVWRVFGHFTWRRVARAAFGLVASNQWLGWPAWAPPSNQIMGMALCQRAAELHNEDYRKEPWN